LESQGYEVKIQMSKIRGNAPHNYKVINAQDYWVINGQGYGFDMLYRLNFENGALIFEKGKLQ